MSGFATEMEVGNWDMEVVAQKKTSKEGKPSVHGINGRKGEVVAHKRGRPREVLLYKNLPQWDSNLQSARITSPMRYHLSHPVP